MLGITGPLLAAEPLARQVPGRPLLCLEAADLASLMAALRASPRMAAWYRTSSYASFLNTKLAQKLSARLAELEAVAGAGFNARNFEAIAGGESALALYDIGRLEILYLSRLPAPKQAAALLGPLEKTFDRRQDSALTYFAKTGADGALELAFAQAGDLLAVSSKVDLLERALRSTSTTAVVEVLAADPRYELACRTEPGPADLRLFLDQGRLCADGYFQTYWIHRNVGELDWIGAAGLIARFHAAGVEERRVFIPASEGRTAPASAPAELPLALLAAGLPASLTCWRLVASPTPEDAADAVLADILEAPSPARDASATLRRELLEAIASVRPEAMARVVGPAPDGREPYAVPARAVVFYGPAAASAPLTSFASPARDWYAAELLGDASHGGIAISSTGAMAAVTLPFGSGRGLHAARAPGRVVLATHATLAAALTGATAPPAAGEKGLSREMRSVDLPALRAAFAGIVKNSTEPSDDLRRYFSGDWEGLLSSFADVAVVADRTWTEGPVVRQVVETRYRPR
ncbi:MAG: hypothetical protein HYY25_15045 [Candidatus Wallbacteria bacterium]|nr:hypothetical protein [Candidatus Wallbacteria bacterium]